MNWQTFKDEFKARVWGAWKTTVLGFTLATADFILHYIDALQGTPAWAHAVIGLVSILLVSYKGNLAADTALKILIVGLVLGNASCAAFQRTVTDAKECALSTAGGLTAKDFEPTIGDLLHGEYAQVRGALATVAGRTGWAFVECEVEKLLAQYSAMLSEGPNNTGLHEAPHPAVAARAMVAGPGGTAQASANAQRWLAERRALTP
jgi:hypothetical protein